MKSKLSLEFVPEADAEAEAKHAELIDLLADGIARHLVAEARAEAERALGRPLRSAAPEEESASPPAPRPALRRRSA